MSNTLQQTASAAAPSLAVVVPCYNEEEVLPIAIPVLENLLKRMMDSGKISDQSQLYFVDDGSRDRTWEILKAKSAENSCITGIKLSRNKGHQNALYAGLVTTREDIVVSIDADLQDDPENIEKMVDEYLAGSDVVYGVRSERTTDTFFKRFTAEGYYKLMKKMGVDLVLPRRFSPAVPQGTQFTAGIRRVQSVFTRHCERNRLSLVHSGV